MRYLAFFFPVMMLSFLGVAAFIYFRVKHTSAKAARDQKDRREAQFDDSTDDTFWELGQNRPIIDTNTGHPGLGRRTFFRRLARAAVVSVVGWVALRVFNTLRAETPKNTDPPMEFAQNNHDDNHHDNHDDGGHSDSSTHIDDGSWHSGYHTDRYEHSDYHSDNGHTDYHGDG